MTIIGAATTFLFVFAGAFALAFLKHDLCAGWARYQQLKKENTDDNA